MIPNVKKGFKLLKCPICNPKGDKPLVLVREYRKTCSSACSVSHSYNFKSGCKDQLARSEYWRERRFNAGC